MRIRQSLKLRHVGSHFFVVNPDNGHIDLTDIYTLNHEAAFLWESIHGQDFTAEMMARRLCEAYEVTYEHALDDVTGMLRLWREYGIIETE